MSYIICFIAGSIIGNIIAYSIIFIKSIEGVIEINHNDNTCKFYTETEKLVDLNKDIVRFSIKHIK